MYATTCSSADERVNRNANGLLRKLASLSTSGLYSRVVQVSSDRGRFAERVLHGVDDAGREERVVVWIERRAGALWAVGRVVNPHLRNGNAAKAGDYVFEGYELEDALEYANATLEDDLTVSERDGRSERCLPFTREECLKPLEAWFFGRSS
jgi:hypothetical protein